LNWKHLRIGLSSRGRQEFEAILALFGTYSADEPHKPPLPILVASRPVSISNAESAECNSMPANQSGWFDDDQSAMAPEKSGAEPERVRKENLQGSNELRNLLGEASHLAMLSQVSR
jgi:hypothetical protein